MKISSLLFLFIIHPFTLFSQTPGKEDKRIPVRYFLKHTDLSRNFIARYSKLIAGSNGYTRKDSVLANHLIKKLRENEEIIFYRFMRIRLEWEFKERLVFAPMDSAKHLMKNNTDSAIFYSMLGNYFKDSMGEKMARRFGFVKAFPDGNEIPDWKKINIFKWNDPLLIESIAIDDLILKKSIDGDNINLDNRWFDNRMKDSSIFYYEKAIEIDKNEIYYLKELLFFLAKLGEEVSLQQTIKQYKDNYKRKEQIWLTGLLAESVTRQEKIKN